MRIESSQISYVTTHRSASSTTVIEQGRVRGLTLNGAALPVSTVGTEPVTADKVQLSPLASSLQGSPGGSNSEDLQDLTPRQRVAALVIQAMFGNRFTGGLFRTSAPAASNTAIGGGAAQVVQRTELHSESEQTHFQAAGEVQTADGRSIQFQATLTMDRRYQSASVTAGPSQTTDPLVVNFGGTPARLTGAQVSFDLNSDGKAESVNFVAAGSGFLALDTNGDGKVNDGQELFGPKTGNGFAELAGYDADQNGWIDENDPVFSKLRIWTQDGLSTLQEKGIGAISTSSVDTPFALKNSANVLQGEIRSSGVYLSENGTAGTIQQVDLAGE